MNKTIKIIDLLNKIANGEEVPKKIRIAGWCYNFEWIEHDSNYFDKNGDIDLMSCLSMCNDELNREIKIIEDNEKIEKIPYQFNLGYIYCNINETAQEEINKTINGIYDKLNEIIDHINKIEEKLDER